ncbi:MAG: peptidylprolyl isomerase [Actinomycetes bacterium]
MTSNKRQRELARAKHERQQARRAAEQHRRRRLQVIIAAVVGVALVVLGGAWLVQSTSSKTPIAEPTVAPSTPASASASVTSDTSGVSCTAAPTSRANDLTWKTVPPTTIKPTGTYTMNLTTNCGDMVFTLDQTKAPATVNSMVFLTDQKYFDLTSCHRLTTEGLFVLQCGDPAGNGGGGPGYALPDENLPADGASNYPRGTVAMANAGKGTGGSQFFIVYQDTTLPPDYTIWGTVTTGLNVVDYVASKGVAGGGSDGAPAQPISIVTATTSYSATGSS